MTTVLSRDKGGKSEYGSTSSLGGSAPLGVPRKYKRFFWQKKAPHDPDAVATQVSVFDDQETAEKYHPRQDW